VKPILNPLKNEMMRAGSEGRQMDMHLKRAEIKRIQAEHGIVPYKSFIPMLQIPLAYGCFRVIRGMTSLPVPGLANESVGWLTDLTVSDPTFILPVATSAMMFLTFKVSWCALCFSLIAIADYECNSEEARPVQWTS
jgi:YidC/Oxa1 family membrane protein insertase